MNLSEAPSLEDLKRLLARQKDKNDHHVLWVCQSGQVHLETLPAGMDPQAFCRARPSMRLCLKTYRRGAGYVGRHAAADEQYTSKLFDCLQEHWPRVAGRHEVACLDRYC